jgi:hypothetical protein
VQIRLALPSLALLEPWPSPHLGEARTCGKGVPANEVWASAGCSAALHADVDASFQGKSRRAAPADQLHLLITLLMADLQMLTL